jgi:acetyltransferase
MAGSILDTILSPASIAIVGASRDPHKRGFRSIQKLLEDGYAGTILPVNPKETEILGLTCYPDLSACPVAADLALICTPAKTVPQVLAQCGRVGIKGAVVLAGGFGETGAAGRQMESELVNAAKSANVRVIGPNTSGIFNTHCACNLVGFPDLKPGHIGLLSQSGNMALALVTEAQAGGQVGLSTYVGVGNESDLQFHEYLDYFEQDPHTRVVIAYIEGLRNGRAFLSALDRVGRQKPVVVYKSGRSNAGKRSALSHTGALAGDFAVSAGVLAQAGAILVRRSDDILPVAETLSLLVPPRSRRVAVLADGGGHATITTDNLVEQGLELAHLEQKTHDALAAILPASASLANPVDVAGGTDADPAVFAACARILLEDANVDSLLITGLYGGYAQRFSETLRDVEIATSHAVADLCASLGKPVLVHSLYACLTGPARPAALDVLRQKGIPVLGSVERTVRCLAALADFGEVRARPLQRAASAAPLPAIQALIGGVRADGRTLVLEHEGRAMLSAVGIAMPPVYLAGTGDQALAAFHALASPVAMKVVSPDVVHKTEAGGVRLGIRDDASVERAFGAILSSARQKVPGADIRGVLVTPMVDAPGGMEVVVGVVRDPSYGPVLMFGLGGILVEVLHDVVFRALPITEQDAYSMMDGIQSHAVLKGVRGSAAVDRGALARLMLGVSRLCTAHPEIAELDLNPVLAAPGGIHVLDVRIVLDGTRG